VSFQLVLGTEITWLHFVKCLFENKSSAVKDVSSSSSSSSACVRAHAGVCVSERERECVRNVQRQKHFTILP